MAILLWTSSIIGQSTFGSIVGAVKDPGEGSIAGAQITLTNLDDHAQRTASADSNGAFEFVNLKPGHYELAAHADGFSEYKISSLQLAATLADSALGCVPVLGADPNMPCAAIIYANKAGLGAGLRQFYGKNFQPRVGFAYRPFGNSKTVVRGGFGIFTMTNLGQLSFNTTNIDVSVVRTTANSFTNGQPAFQFPSARTQGAPAAIAGTGDFYQNTLTNYRDPQSAQWNFTVERELSRDITLRERYVGMSSYRMSQTIDLNQVEPSAISPNPNPKPYSNWGRILSTTNSGHVNYHGLQSELNMHSRGGLTFQASHA